MCKRGPKGCTKGIVTNHGMPVRWSTAHYWLFSRPVYRHSVPVVRLSLTTNLNTNSLAHTVIRSCFHPRHTTDSLQSFQLTLQARTPRTRGRTLRDSLRVRNEKRTSTVLVPHVPYPTPKPPTITPSFPLFHSRNLSISLLCANLRPTFFLPLALTPWPIPLSLTPTLAKRNRPTTPAGGWGGVSLTHLAHPGCPLSSAPVTQPNVPPD